MSLLSDSEQLPPPLGEGKGKTAEEPKILDYQASFPSQHTCETNRKETSKAFQEKMSSQGFTN